MWNISEFLCTNARREKVKGSFKWNLESSYSVNNAGHILLRFQYCNFVNNLKLFARSREYKTSGKSSLQSELFMEQGFPILYQDGSLNRLKKTTFKILSLPKKDIELIYGA